MAFPTITATSEAATWPAQAQHVLTMPACASGNLLLTGMMVDTNATITSGFSAWTCITAATVWGGTSGSAHYYKTSTGTDTVTVDLSGSVRIAYIIRCISGHNPSGTVEASTIAGVTTSANPDPGSLTPSWGAKDTLFIAWTAFDAAPGSVISAYPTTYNTNQETNESTTAVGYAQATCSINTTTSDPGTFTLTVSDAWLAGTLAIEPASAGSAPGRMMRGLI